MKKSVEFYYVGIDEFRKISDAVVELGKMGHYAYANINARNNDTYFTFGLMKGGFESGKDFDIYTSIDIDDQNAIALNETENYKAYSQLLDQIHAVLNEDHEDKVIWPNWRNAGECDE